MEKILVITDDTDAARYFADEVARYFENSPSLRYHVSIVDAAGFSGTDLLPVFAFLIGCELPNAFAPYYISDFFNHINLAGRPCGIFSPNREALKYLAGMLKPSEAAIGNPFIFKNGAIEEKELAKWVDGILLP